MSEDPAFFHYHEPVDGRCLDLDPPVVVAPSGEGFRGRKGAGCLSGAAGVASSAPPAKILGARETPARTAGRGRGSRACFLVTSLHEQRSHSGRAGESAPGSMWTEATVNTRCRTGASHHMAGDGPKARKHRRTNQDQPPRGRRPDEGTVNGEGRGRGDRREPERGRRAGCRGVSCASKSAPARAPSPCPSWRRACRIPSCPWPARSRAWRGHASSTGPSVPGCSPCVPPRRPGG